jgi:tripartite-type tricarboxylate transporter receptor subunit TctC
MRIDWRSIAAAATGLALLAIPDAGQAQETFPSRPVRIVVPYSPGSVVDVFAHRRPEHGGAMERLDRR